jgi:hypothetical protein
MCATALVSYEHAFRNSKFVLQEYYLFLFKIEYCDVFDIKLFE